MRAADSSMRGDFAEDVEELLSQIQFVEITRESVDLLYSSPPTGVRTLDAIHLATLAYVRRSAEEVSLATYDCRLALAAESMGFKVIAP